MTDHIEEAALKPCPFCGGEASCYVGQHNIVDAKIGCDDCGAEGGVYDDETGLDLMAGDGKDQTIKSIKLKNIASAIAEWNNRPGETLARKATLEEAAKVADTAKEKCFARAKKYRDKDKEWGEGLYESAGSEAADIAAAIRALSVEG